MGVRGLVADVGRLPDTQRSALVLRELEGRSYADIADELDVTVPAVKSLLVRARQGLKRARDDRRVAAWLPFPLLGRLAERVGSLWEPVAASATPKVACAAVVVASSLPVMSGKTPAPVQHPSHARPAVTAVAQTPSPPPAKAEGAPGSGAEHAAKIPAGLSSDCADGAIDGTYSNAVLRAALEKSSNGGAEYGGCRQALLTASWG
jgi:hypothetical protein